MRVNDVLAGAFFFALAAFIFVYAAGLPPLPGQRYGAGAFPIAIALGLGGFSLLLMWRARRTRGTALRWAALAPWARDRRTLGTFVLALVLILLYVLLSERVGFIPMSFAMLVILFVCQGVPWRRSVIVAAAATLTIQIVFADLLRVPLPRGILTGVLW